jgi:hypothetical protein
MDLACLNNNTYFVAFMMMLWITCSRFFYEEVDPRFQKVLKRPWARVLIVFSALFVISRSIQSAAIVTLVFILLFRILLASDCPWNMLWWFEEDIPSVKDGKDSSTLEHSESWTAQSNSDPRCLQWENSY